MLLVITIITNASDDNRFGITIRASCAAVTLKKNRMFDGTVICITKSDMVKGKQIHSKQFVIHAVTQNIRAKNAKKAKTITIDNAIFEKTFLNRTKKADDG